MLLRLTFLALIMTCFIQVKDGRAEALEFHTLDLPPFGFKEPNGPNSGQRKGMLFDIAKAITEEANIPAVHTLVPLVRVIKELQGGKKLCTIVTRSPFSEAMATPLAYIGLDAKGAIVPRANLVLNSYDDLKGLKIGVTRGTVMYHAFDQDESLDKRFTNHDKQSVLMLQRNRVDAIAGALDAIYFNMAKLNFDRSDLPQPLVLVSREFWLHCPKNGLSPETLASLTEATKRLVDRGTLKEIWDGYLK